MGFDEASANELLIDANFFFSSRRRHTRSLRDWSSDVCSSDLDAVGVERVVHDRVADAVATADAGGVADHHDLGLVELDARGARSEERRVGKECRSRRAPYH